jgi:hypothetical protein
MKKYLAIIFFIACIFPGRAEINYGLFNKLDAENAVDSFPYNQFLAGIKPENISEIRNYKRVMDSLRLPSNKILFNALTTHLKANEKAKTEGFDVEYMLEKLSLGTRYTDVGDFYTEDPIVYKAIGSSWLDFVADKISDTVKSAPQLKNNPVIAGMLNRLVEYHHNPESYAASNMTKVLYNLSNGKWSYLMDRLQVASTKLKIALLLISLILLIEQVIVLRVIIHALRSRKN